MRASCRSSRSRLTLTASALVLAALVGGSITVRPAEAGFPWFKKGHHHHHGTAACTTCVPQVGEGAWYWVRSPEQERQAVMSLYNRYCIRCHGVDGRGVWDIPGVPDLTNPHWQATRDDSALVRSILEGRGAVMPPFRGTMTLEEAWGMSRYLRTFVPGTEMPRPIVGSVEPPPGAVPATAARVATASPRPPAPETPRPVGGTTVR